MSVVDLEMGEGQSRGTRVGSSAGSDVYKGKVDRTGDYPPPLVTVRKNRLCSGRTGRTNQPNTNPVCAHEQQGASRNY